jgi:hypothetical protein
MPIGTQGTQNQWLDALLGTTRAAGVPATYKIEGWIDNPLDPGADEADFDGYTPPSWDSDDWDAAADGEKETSSLVSLGTPTSDESDRIRYFVLRNETTDQIAFSAALDEKVDIIDGVEVEIRPVIRWVRRS